jgi:hypothetical protein
MAQLPFPLTATDLDDMKFQIWEILRQVYEEKIGGAELGDVFSIPGDVLTLVLESPSGLTKTGNKLAIEPISTGGMQIGTTGLSIKIVSTGGLETSAAGLGIKLDGASLSLGAAGLKVTTVGSASGTVVTEITFGQSSTAGILDTYSRGDHTHGTPPQSYSLVTHNINTVLAVSDLNKIHTMDVSGGDRSFTLPDTAAGNVGYWVKLVRIGVANILRVQAGAGDMVWNSSVGGYIECDDTHDFSSVNLVQAAVGYWTTPEFGIWTSY